MKTIYEAARSVEYNSGILMSTIQQIADESFKSGAKFAQRWIPVEEELPESSDKLLIVKWLSKNGEEKLFPRHI